uniref:Uncharacterized protein n=1 Tax=Anguilla anguilla TaxID=7936 RepID=A0A0E9UV76_ANGAN
MCKTTTANKTERKSLAPLLNSRVQNC